MLQSSPTPHALIGQRHTPVPAHLPLSSEGSECVRGSYPSARGGAVPPRHGAVVPDPESRLPGQGGGECARGGEELTVLPRHYGDRRATRVRMRRGGGCSARARSCSPFSSSLQGALLAALCRLLLGARQCSSRIPLVCGWQKGVVLGTGCQRSVAIALGPTTRLGRRPTSLPQSGMLLQFTGKLMQLNPSQGPAAHSESSWVETSPGVVTHIFKP